MTDIPSSSITVACDFLDGSVLLSNVSGISIGGLALGFTVFYDDSFDYTVDVSDNLVSSEIDACDPGVFCDSNQNVYGLCSGTDIYELSLPHLLFTFSNVAFCDANNNVYYYIGG
ncbi:MAG: hypothetical protein JHC26_07785 [Thermofilum sp.]|nr:hypothetical protein [Thermofilum sp.]